MTQDVSRDLGGVPDTHAPAAVDTLKQAMRRARADDSERMDARASLRASRLGRLEMLQDALQPLIAQVPAEVELFDVALVPAPEPRLFIDMLGFVEMGRDARLYILNQDTRHGRMRLAESDSLDSMVEAVTDYIARRLLERDKALAADIFVFDDRGAADRGVVTRHPAEDNPAEGRAVLPSRTPAAVQTAAPPPTPTPTTSIQMPPRKAGPLRWLGIAFAFLIDVLGFIAFFSILFGVGYILYMRMQVQT